MNTYTARPFILAETNWQEVAKTDFELAVLPWGATEAHNYHMPYGTDNIQNDYIAAGAAKMTWEKGGKVIVLPSIPFGVNTGQLDVRLDMNLMPSTQFAILNDVADVLSRHGIRKFLIFNGHGGNDFKQMVRELGSLYPDLFISTCHWFRAVSGDGYFTEMGDHAGEMETSAVMHIAPHLVRPLSEAGDGSSRKFRSSMLNESWAWAERSWTSITRDTGVGDPKDASPERGEAYLTAVISKLSTLFDELCRLDPGDAYE